MRNWKNVFGKSLAAAALALPLLTTAAASAQDQPGYSDQQNAPDPPTRAARLSYLHGNVSLQPNGAPDWDQAAPNYPLSSGDRLYTDQDSRAELQVGNSAVRLDAGTDLTVTGLTDNFLQLGLASGTIHLRTYGLNPGDSQEIDTPNGAVLISQPGDIRISSDPNSGTVVEVFSGAVQLTGPDLNQSVYAGTTVELNGTNPIYVAQIDFPGEDGFDAWSAARDQRLANSVSAQYVSRQMPGYDDLDQYGDWEPNAPQYGPVWYPRDVPYGWAPYSQGYWAQVGPWGWTWVDTTGPWGYAPFHYGRWALIGDRWGWLPGPVADAPVYSPALVAFAGGGGFSIGIGFGGGGIAAWFPLGPRDPFIPWYHASPRYVTNVNITNVTVVNRVYVNNVVNNYNVNHTEINNYHYTNVSHVVAVPANNFAGHPVHGSEVKLTPQQVQNIRPAVGVGQVPVREPARPASGAAANASGYRPVGLQPAARPVAANVARPSVITPKGVSSTQPGAVARPVPRGLASVNSTRPAPAPRQGAVTGNKPMPAPATPSRPMPGAPARPAVERPTQPAVNPQQQDQQRQQQMQQQKQQQLDQKQQQDQVHQQQLQQKQQQDQVHEQQLQQKQQQEQVRQQQEQQKQQQQLMQQQKVQQQEQQEQEKQRQLQLKKQQQKPAPPARPLPAKPQKPVKPPPPQKKDDDQR